MIAQLHGTVADIAQDSAVLDVSGVGYEVRMPSSELGKLHVGRDATLYTHLSVSQDAVALYGFLERGEKDIFLRLQKASGIGPKAALSLLSTCGADGLLSAIAKGDATALTKAKGVGIKGARKIIVELSGIVTDIRQEEGQGATKSAPRYMREVIEGLCSLGFDERTARSTVESVMEEHGIQSDIPADQVVSILRESLSEIGRSKK